MHRPACSGPYWRVGLRQGERAHTAPARLAYGNVTLWHLQTLSFLRQSTLLVNAARALVSCVTASGVPKEPTPTCLVSIFLGASR